MNSAVTPAGLGPDGGIPHVVALSFGIQAGWRLGPGIVCEGDPRTNCSRGRRDVAPLTWVRAEGRRPLLVSRRRFRRWKDVDLTGGLRNLLSLEATRRTLVPSGDAAIAAFEYGSPKGFPVILIHGWSCSHLWWYRQLAHERLAARCRLIAIDLRGHGDSSGASSEGVAPAMQAGDVRAVLDHFGIDDAVLIGWSLGGVVLCDYLAMYGGDRVAAAVFVGSPVDVDPGSDANDAGPALAAALAGMTGMDLTTGEVEEPAAADNLAATMDFAEACVLHRLEREDAAALLAVSMVVAPASRRAVLNRRIDGKAVPMLSALSRAREQGLRGLVMCGDADRVCNPRGSERLAATLGIAVQRYVDAGHALVIDQPERFADDLLRLVDVIEAGHGDPVPLTASVAERS